MLNRTKPIKKHVEGKKYPIDVPLLFLVSQENFIGSSTELF